MCIDNTPIVYFFDGNKKGCLNLESGSVENDILVDVRKKFIRLKAKNIDKNLSVGQTPYSLFEQELFIQELKDNGITTIISLEQKSEIGYDKKVLENEFEFINIPLPDKSIPTIENLDKIISIINKSKKCYIYSDSKSDRLNIIVNYYQHH
jgi:hypothetical protein